MPLYKRSDIERYRENLDSAYQEIIAILDADNVDGEHFVLHIQNTFHDDVSNYCELKNIRLLNEACSRLQLATKHLSEMKALKLQD